MKSISICCAVVLALTIVPASFVGVSASPVDYAARCKSFAGEWKAAEASHSSDPNIGKARAFASSAELMCASTKASDESIGVNKYIAALKACHAYQY